MKKLMKYVISWTFPAVVLFLVIMGNSQAATVDGGALMCPPHRPADGGICDPSKLKDEDTPPIPPSDGGVPPKTKVKIQFKGRELDFVPAGAKTVLDAGLDLKLVSERRSEVVSVSYSIRDDMSKKLKTEVKIHKILFAQNFTAKADAAITVFETDGKETAVVFLFSNGEWSTLPTDLIEFVP